MGLSQLNFEGKNKIEVAINRVINYQKQGEPYYGTFSGGKDSTATKLITKLANSNVEWHYHLTGIDPPEVVYFIRNFHPDVIIDKPNIRISDGILKHGMPTRLVRWCCEELKEGGGSGRIILTGVRAAESAKRKNRKLVEHCIKNKTKIFVNPIIDWTDKDVWELINLYNEPYCKLYDEKDEHGNKLFKRLGCVLCPLETPRQTIIEMRRFPKIAEIWHRACIKRWENRQDLDFLHKFNNGEEYWQYWLSRKGQYRVDEAQRTMFG